MILSLDWVDLGGTFKAIGGAPSATVIQVSLDQNLHNGWSMDYEGLPAVDLFIPAETDATVAALVGAIGAKAKPKKPHAARPHPLKDKPAPDSEMAAADMANVLRHVVGDRTTCLTHVSLSWHGEFWPFRHPLDYVGSDGGGGVGGGPGISVGAALALKGTGRLPIAVCGDGDFMMGNTAVWTAAHYRIPILFVVANNRSFYNDEVHQERVAVARNRPVDNKWIGQRIADPDIDIGMVARGQGAKGFGPCRNAGELEKALKEAIAVVEGGGVAVVDARILGGYSPATAAAMARGKADRGT